MTSNTAKTKNKASAKITKDTYVHWYKSMLVMRKFEEATLQAYGRQKIRGFLHVYIGQEAVAAGLISGLQDSDPIVTAYRDHALGLARGITSREGMAELYGKVTGCTQGRGGSMHFFTKEGAFYGGHGIVGGQIGLGTGIAFAQQYQETGNICACLFGDGAARQGILHETFNMAMTWKLPVLYIIENNGYAMGTSVSRTSNVKEMYTMGESYDMPAEAVDGMDVVAMHNAVQKAAKHIRSGKGPYLLEVKTYRYKGHSVSDPQKYRTKKEVSDYKDRDPIEQVLDVIKKKKYLTEEEIKTIQTEVKEEIADSVKFAEESPYPPDSDVYKEVYVQPDYPFLKS